MTDPRAAARREADRLRAKGTRIPQIDDWRCYRCGTWHQASDPHEDVSTVAGYVLRVCSPRCPK